MRPRPKPNPGAKGPKKGQKQTSPAIPERNEGRKKPTLGEQGPGSNPIASKVPTVMRGDNKARKSGSRLTLLNTRKEREREEDSFP